MDVHFYTKKKWSLPIIELKYGLSFFYFEFGLGFRFEYLGFSLKCVGFQDDEILLLVFKPGFGFSLY